MKKSVASVIMPRTTLNIDRPILDELKRRGKAEGVSLGQLTSDLLAQALADSRPEASREASKFRWNSRSMEALVDLDDKEAIYRVLEESEATSAV